jgi:hypothetical protein
VRRVSFFAAHVPVRPQRIVVLSMVADPSDAVLPPLHAAIAGIEAGHVMTFSWIGGTV